ncbi:MAG: tetratricopeptide repeat protein [Phycisphaerales bacterium]
MASKVNVKFVAVLGTVLVLLGAGVGYSAYAMLVKSADDHARAAKAAGAEGDWTTAEMHASKAVSKEKANPEYVKLWKEALEHIVPTTQVAFDDKLQRWFGACRQLGIVQRDNIAAQRDYLESRRKTLIAGAFNRQAAEFMVTECDAFIAMHSGKPSGEWETLRRYRGLARLRLLAETPDARPSAWTDCKDDFEAALKADPADGAAAVGLEGLLQGMAARATQQGDTQAAADLEKAAGEVFTKFLAANPNNTEVQLAFIRRGLGHAVLKFQSDSKALTDAGKPPLDPAEAGRRFAEQFKEPYEAAWAGVAALDPAKVDVDLIAGLRQLEATLEPQTSPARCQELTRRLLEANPTSADLIALRADLLSQQDNFADAAAQLKAILDLPPKGVGLEGARLFQQKSQARFFQAMWSLRDAVRATPETLDAKVASAKSYVAAFGTTEAADSTRMRLAEAWLAFVEGDMEKSDRLFDNLFKVQQGLDVDSMLIWAQVAVRRQQPGAARDRLAYALQVQPQNYNATVALAELHVSLREYDKAREVYEGLARIYPDRAELKERLSQVGAAADPTKAADVKDPVVRLLLEAEGISRKGAVDTSADRQIATLLESGLTAHNWDPRIAQALAMVYRRLGEPEKAGNVLRDASAKHPDNKALRNLAIALAERDEYAMRLKLIELSDQADVEKALQRYQVARDYKKEADVEKALADLQALGKDNAQVLEVSFIEALQKKDLDRANQLADEAARLNADKYEGRTFRARLLAAQARFREAADLMQEVVNTGGAQPEAFRLLGRFLMADGRKDDAVANYRVSLARRPNDPEGLKDLMKGLVEVDRASEALAVARSGLAGGQGDREFEDIWLRLEQQVGDANVARVRRERIATVRENDRDNLLALGEIYLRLNDVAKAEQMVARVRALGEDLDSVGLEAALLWASNKRAEAAGAYDAFRDKQAQNKQKLDTQIASARFLFSRNDLEGASQRLDAARAYQDPKALEADKAITDLFIFSGVPARAVDALRRILEAGGDTPDFQFRKRLVEALISLGKFQEAETELAPLLKVAQPDHISLLLNASIRGGLGDPAGQRRALDDAVAKYPKEPTVFIRRGQFLALKDETLRDAIADFTQASALAPNMWQTYRLRAAAYAKVRDRDGKPIETDRALEDLKRALTLNPFDNDLLVGLVSDLVRLGRDQEAQAAVADVIKARPRDPIIFVQMGNLFLGGGRVTIAQDFFTQALALDPNDGVVQRTLDALLDPRSPNIIRAEEVLNTIGTDRVSKNPGFLMATARIRAAQNRKVDANKAVLEAVRLLDPSKESLMVLWHQDMQRIQPDVAQHIAFLQAAINQGAVAGAADWLGHFRAALLVQSPGTFEDGIKELAKLAQGARPEIVRLLSYRLMGAKQYENRKFDLAEKAWRDGLAAFPNDPELNNNVAYVTAVDLNRPADAIPFAQKARDVDPENADIADTLAYALFKAGKVSEAVDIYTETIDKNRIRSARTGVHMLSHLAEALITLSQQAPTPEERQRLTNRARDYVRMAESIVSQPSAAIDPVAKAEFERVRTMVGQ